MTTPVGTTDATRPNDIWPHTLLVGPLGIGKSHLLRHFATTLEQGSTEAREQGSENPKSEIRNPKFLYLEHRLRLKIEGSVASIAGRPLEIAFIVRSNGHLETNELLPAEDSITYEVEHYEIWAPADPTVLRILPGLAEEIGLNQSIVLLQLDYWIRHSDNVRDGRRWTYQSLRGMRKKAFKWWRKDTIRNPKSEIQSDSTRVSCSFSSATGSGTQTMCGMGNGGPSRASATCNTRRSSGGAWIPSTAPLPAW